MIPTRFALALVLSGFAETALATKPCPPSPCAPHGAFDAAACAAAADWVATGVVDNVEHHRQGEPLFKDFADFDFVSRASEKGAGPARVHFQVGWCENRVEPPGESGTEVRVYGVEPPSDPAQPSRYLWIERAPRD